MRRPRRSDDKYWTGTRVFNDLQFESDLQDYIDYLLIKCEHEKEPCFEPIDECIKCGKLFRQ